MHVTPRTVGHRRVRSVGGSRRGEAPLHGQSMITRRLLGGPLRSAPAGCIGRKKNDRGYGECVATLFYHEQTIERGRETI